MKRSIFVLSIITMSLFSFMSQGKSPNNKKSTPIIGMVLLKDSNSLKIAQVITELQENWNLTVKHDKAKEGETTSVVQIGQYMVAIASIPIPVPGDEVKETATYNYFWKEGKKEAPQHKGHIIVSIINAGINPVEENIIFTKVTSAILNHSDALGVYIGERTLLLNKKFYLANTELMSEESLPIYNWVYFGLRKENGRQSVYTYGLSQFGKLEMEIVRSKHSLETLSDMMYNITHYVLAYNVSLKHGETIGLSATQKLKITKSKGVYLDDKTLKIEF